MKSSLNVPSNPFDTLKSIIGPAISNRKAAEQGDASAQSNLGGMYARGEGVPKGLVIAYMWRNLAAAKGDENAQRARDALESLMAPAQIAEAQKLSREWKPKK